MGEGEERMEGVTVSTFDLFEAAYYITRGLRLTRIEMMEEGGRPSGKLYFRGRGAEELQSEYVNGRASAGVRALKSALSHIKDLVFRARREYERERW